MRVDTHANQTRCNDKKRYHIDFIDNNRKIDK